MNIITIPNGTAQGNCYIAENGSDAVVIDPGCMENRLSAYIAENLGKIKMILLTHRHFDHLSAAVSLRKATGAKIVIHELDECGLYSDMLSLSRAMGGSFYEKADPDTKADIYVDDEDTVNVGGMRFKVIHTPGHTEGGVCYLCDNILFSGDTLFKGSIGRTDFPSGNSAEMRESLNRLCQLPDSTVVYPGHGPVTSIGEEKANNMFIKR